jgi:hypothetical protein
LLNNEEVDLSVNTAVIEQIKALLTVLQAYVSQVKICHNSGSVFLAKFARINSRRKAYATLIVFSDFLSNKSFIGKQKKIMTRNRVTQM